MIPIMENERKKWKTKWKLALYDRLLAIWGSRCRDCLEGRSDLASNLLIEV